MEVEVRVTHPSGLHARPAARFVEEAKRFAADIRLCVGERAVDAKSILGVLSLGIRQGTVVRLRATGPDAAAALDALTPLVATDLGDDP